MTNRPLLHHLTPTTTFTNHPPLPEEALPVKGIWKARLRVKPDIILRPRPLPPRLPPIPDHLKNVVIKKTAQITVMAKTVTGGGKREQIQGIQGEVEVESVVTAREAPPENLSTKNLIIIRNANGNKSYGTAEQLIRIAASIRKLLTQLTTGLLSQCQCQVEGAVLCQLLAQWGAGPAFTRFTTITTTIAAATTATKRGLMETCAVMKMRMMT